MRIVLILFGQVSDEDIEWVLQVGRKETVAANQFLIVEGQPFHAVYLVLVGTFSATVASLDDREVNRLGCGEIVGEVSFVDARRPAHRSGKTADCVGVCTLG